jgi:hypothetical protein
MRQWLPVLMVLAGLGSLISCKRSAAVSTSQGAVGALGALKVTAVAPKRVGNPSVDPNPFDRYLVNTQANWPEPALMRFAGECKVDLDSISPRFAQRPSEKWIQVKDLSKALKDQETDFYGTAEVWNQGARSFVEQWGMELDTGDYYRLFYCIERKKVTLAESVSWRVGLNDDSSKDSGWGYDHAWKLGPDGKFATVQTSFVDLHERPMTAPKLDAETATGLNEEGVGAKTWTDLDLPNELL